MSETAKGGLLPADFTGKSAQKQRETTEAVSRCRCLCLLEGDYMSGVMTLRPPI
ncbi:hypothetical protein [uncultured Mailhella sp.]|uniref:hypothetical protein n=1 Tax=uncultured Mailhella sp. TaxID=1981031 RepID=UPI003458ADBA